MTCEEIRERFAEALYGELDAPTMRAVEEHLASCKECAFEFARLKETLAVMNERVRPEPDWDSFSKSLDARLQAEHSSQPQPRIFQFIPPRVPAWAYGIAAMLLIAVGIYLGRTYFGADHPLDNGSQPSTITMNPPQQSSQPDSTAELAMAYLERSKNLLIGMAHYDKKENPAFDLNRRRQVSRELLNQGNVLKVALNKPDQQLLRQLVSDLEIILLQLSNLEVKPGVPAVELVKKGIDEKSILLKINLEEMRAMARESAKNTPRQDNDRTRL